MKTFLILLFPVVAFAQTDSILNWLKHDMGARKVEHQNATDSTHLERLQFLRALADSQLVYTERLSKEWYGSIINLEYERAVMRVETVDEWIKKLERKNKRRRKANAR